MKHIYFYLFFTLFAVFSAFAQDHYRPATLYTMQGDTVSGDLNSQRTARYIKFKAAGKSITEYTPHEIDGFVYEGRIFISKEVETEEVPGVKVVEPVFMEVLAKGRASLYYYKERDSEENFYLLKGDQLYKLRMVKKVVQRDGVDYFLKHREYLGVLRAVFSDCPKTKEKEYDFTRSDLAAAVFTYNTCFGEEKPTITYKRERIRIHPGVKAGINRFSQAEANTGYGSLVGVFINMPLTGASRVLSTQVELTYDIFNTADYSYGFRYKYVNMGAFIRYTYPKGWIRPYMTTGVLYGRGDLRVDYKWLGRSYEAANGRMVRVAAEAGIQVPVRRRYVYSGLRYDHFLSNKINQYKSVNLSLAVGL